MTTLRLLSIIAVPLLFGGGFFIGHESAAPQAHVLQDVAYDLSGQAGTIDEIRTLLNAAPQDARTHLIRCQTEFANRGPVIAEPLCRYAATFTDEAKITHSLTLSWLGRYSEALAVLPLGTTGLTKVKSEWAAARALRLSGHQSEAAAAARHASAVLDQIVERDPSKAEFKAIAGLRLGEASGDRAVLQAALSRQIVLDIENEGYAEYTLYRARILRALGETEAATVIMNSLRARDPRRWEYGEGF